MKHGDFLCFVTRIVEKSWKNYATCRAQKEPFLKICTEKTYSPRMTSQPTPMATCHYKHGYILEPSRQSGIHKGLWAQTTPCFSLFPPQIVENRGKQTDCTPPCNRPHGPFRLLAIALSSPSFSLQRESIRPRRQLAHLFAQLLDGTESLWDLGYKLVVYV